MLVSTARARAPREVLLPPQFFAGADEDADGALADIVGGIQPGTIEKGEDLGPLMK